MTPMQKLELRNRLLLTIERLKNLERFALKIGAVDVGVRLTTAKNAAAAALEVARDKGK